jgi:hypothetical protein
MLPSSILNAADMAQARFPEHLRAWVIQKCGELGQSPEARAFSQSGATLAKKFHDEIYPLSVFAAREYQDRDDVLIEPNLDNDNFDAKVVVFGPSGAKTSFVEITCAKDGYDESRRMEVVLKEGGVVMTGPITTSGRRGAPDRIVKVTPEAVSHTETLERYLRLIETTVQAKSRIKYGAQHTLLVAVDDYLALIQDSDWPLLAERAESWIRGLQPDFGRVVCLGLAGRLFLSYALPMGEGCALTSA